LRSHAAEGTLPTVPGFGLPVLGTLPPGAAFANKEGGYAEPEAINDEPPAERGCLLLHVAGMTPVAHRGRPDHRRPGGLLDAMNDDEARSLVAR